MVEAGMAVEIAFMAGHSDEPLRPASSAEMVAAFDDMVRLRERYFGYMLIFVDDSSGEPFARMGIGVAGDPLLGAISYSGPDGSFLSRGVSESVAPVVMYHFGEVVYHPESAMIPIDAIRSALTRSYDLGFAKRPETIEWQDWFDCVLIDEDL